MKYLVVYAFMMQLAMALMLVRAARCEAGGNVLGMCLPGKFILAVFLPVGLDVGHGTGESLLMQLSHPSVPRPSHLTGITSLAVHYDRAKDRVTRLLSSETDPPKTKVTLHHGDAVYWPSAVNHPLEPSLDAPPYTAILALDCAYHFKSRQIFLQQSFIRLAPGGRIALADICLSQGRLTKFCLLLLGVMPKENMISPDEYARDLKDIGYVDVEVQDVSPDVFPGLVRFFKGRGGCWWVFGNVIRWFAASGGRFVLVSGAKASGVNKT
jgi:SAM-dependent methyltransferase